MTTTDRTDWQEVLADLPDGWRLLRLKHVADITNSNVDKKSYEGGTPVRLCNYTDVYYQEFITDDLDLMRATATESEIERFSLEPGDVIITKDSESWDDIAVPAVVAEELDDVVCGYHLTMLRPHHSLVDGRFLHRALQSSGIREQFHVAAKGITRYGLSQHHIQDVWLPLPPLDEQRQLADYLDRKTAEVDRLIDKKRALIARLGELRASVIQRAVTKGLEPGAPMKDSGVGWLGEVPVGWTMTKLKYELDSIGTGGTPSTSNPAYWADESGTAWVAISDISSQARITQTAKRVTDAGLKAGRLDVLPAGTLLISIFASLGKTSVLGVDATINQAILGLLPSASLSRDFLRFYLIALEPYIGFYSSSNTQENLNLTKVKNLDIPLPPIEEQEQIVSRLQERGRAIDEIVERERRLIERLQELRASIVSEVVTGKIGVRGAALAESVEPREVQDVNPFTLWVLANYVLNRMASADHFGRITLVKVLFALQYELRLRLTGKKYADPWQRWDFGPFNPKLVNALEASLDREGYWRKVQTDDDRQVRYEPKENASDPKGHFEKYWGDRRDEIDAIIDVFERVTSKGDAARRAEIVATLYGAWNDLLIAGEPFTDDDVVAEARENWHPSKLKIECERWHKALGWMREHEFTPSGFGAPVVPREVAA